MHFYLNPHTEKIFYLKCKSESKVLWQSKFHINFRICVFNVWFKRPTEGCGWLAVIIHVNVHFSLNLHREKIFLYDMQIRIYLSFTAIEISFIECLS